MWRGGERRARGAAVVGVSLLLVGVMVLVTGGCAANPPLKADELVLPQLRAIQASYSQTVRRAREDGSVRWRSGWTGNMVVNLGDGVTERGLCWQWRDLVYAGVAPTARSVGWEARGLTVNWGTWLEHNVVIVYDPSRVDAWALFAMPRPRPVWVLDAWENGRAEIYQLDAWLANNPDFLDAATVVELPVVRVISKRGSGE